jgi:hypothetical protein
MLASQVSRALFPAVLAFAAFGCSGTDGAVSSFDGTYHGTYSGSDSGTVLITVTNGNVSLSATSTFWKTTYAGSGTLTSMGELVGSGGGGTGTVSAGGIEISYGGISISFGGSIRASSASGTWSSSNSGSGTWQAAD